MAPALIVKRFDVFKERTLRLVTRLEPIAELGLHRREKRFHHRVVETITAAAHAARDAMGPEDRLVILTRIRTPAVGVMQKATLGAPTLQRHLQRLDRQVSIVRRADGPPDDKPGEQVENGGKIQLAALADDELRRVADPALVHCRRRELPIEQIRGHGLVMIAHGRDCEPLAHPCFQALFLHQSDHALAADVFLLFEQILVDTRAAVPMLAPLKRRPDQHFQAAIVTGMRRFQTALPGVEATARHAQTATENTDGMLGLLRRDEGKPHRLCFAKKAAAFFRISRSSWAIRNSFRSRASSSRSAVVRPVLPCVRSARARSTQLRSADSVKPKSRATAPIVLPSSSTSRTAPAMNSSLNRRRARRPVLLDPILDIVSALRKVSTKSDQAHPPADGRTIH